MKYFGTDGIRGRVNSKHINGDMFFKFGLAAGKYFTNLKKKKQTAIIAKDTRLSGYTLEPALVSGLTSAGMHVFTMGPIPTNALAMLTKSMNANLGIMITASHNQFYDNGLKLFGPDGLKLSSKIENKIEKLIDEDIKKHLTANTLLGRVKRLESGTDNYIRIIKKRINKKVNLKNLKIVIDCANGASYKAAPQLFRSLKAKIILIGDKPNGFNINKNCGSTYPQILQKKVKQYKADLGISFDGDADRIIMCDEKGTIIDGDQIIAAIALQWKKKKILKGGVVGTLMSNYGLEKFFKQKKIKFIRANVGDKYVKELMQKYKFNLGGEQSGHIILGKYATTGDGLLVALETVKALNGKMKASIFFNVFKKTPQILENIKCKKENILNDPKVKKVIRLSKEKIKGQGRILVRKSGTEPLIRVMGESDNINLLKIVLKKITQKLL
ncbi:phosphoglucosamine mutase [Candidatus Pelagibacter sp.]|jgi:phosphoglucosamine mutase|nr:phosphoglucosamine mutase [Candidatus Pelagibacter sp.]MDC3384902.1 phosphoglucosamine mutase [Candidatus Pelagibacter sp.]